MMAAIDSQVRFCADESALGLGKTLAIARKDVIDRHWPAVERAVADEPRGPWIKVITKNGLRDARLPSS